MYTMKASNISKRLGVSKESSHKWLRHSHSAGSPRKFALCDVLVAIRAHRYRGCDGQDLAAIVDMDQSLRQVGGFPTFPDLGPDLSRAHSVLNCLTPAEVSRAGEMIGAVRMGWLALFWLTKTVPESAVRDAVLLNPSSLNYILGGAELAPEHLKQFGEGFALHLNSIPQTIETDYKKAA
jgi:hypothetical protein